MLTFSVLQGCKMKDFVGPIKNNSFDTKKNYQKYLDEIVLFAKQSPMNPVYVLVHLYG